MATFSAFSFTEAFPQTTENDESSSSGDWSSNEGLVNRALTQPFHRNPPGNSGALAGRKSSLSSSRSRLFVDNIINHRKDSPKSNRTVYSWGVASALINKINTLSSHPVLD